MSEQHTPGPWFWDSDPVKGDPTGRVRYRVVATGRTITQMYYSNYEGGLTSVAADAGLIAAAPCMLTALRRAALALAFAAESSPAMQDDYKVVSDAIAKATGGKP